MRLAYQAMDKSGRVVNDVIEASNLLEATDMLRRSGLFVTTLNETSAQAAKQVRSARKSSGPKGKLKNVAMFTRQLSVLVSTGTPLVQSIAALEKQSKDLEWRMVVGGLRERIEGGESFAKALQAYPNQFDPIYRSLVEAGETSGQLGEMLRRLSQLSRQRMHIRNIVLGAMMYPLILIMVAVIVLGVLIGFVLPRFTDLFETLDAALPPTTQFLLLLSEFVRSYWWGLIPALFGVGFGIVYAIRSESGRRTLDVISLRIPKFGQIFRNFATARMTRLLGILLESKVSLLESLTLTREGCTNTKYKELLIEAEEVVTRGENLSSALARSEFIDPTIAEAVRCGEESGQMGSVLLNISEFMDEENEVVLKSLSSIIEPIILIVLGVLVGIVAISMFMPLFDITSSVPGGGG
ncbi:MAG: type II secretion system F family protein [Planctomycetota bacterium]|nr:type II secretion system F family protein [Planctomycetota bacterium]